MTDRFDALPANLYEITRLIAGIEAKGSFATSFTVSADCLQLTVDGAGRVSLPVLAVTARKLRKLAQPAHYGLKDQTLLDPAVRDTWEIPGSCVSIDPDAWQPTLKEALERIRRDLGLSLESQIEAQLHNLLIYGPGQFFKPHQDSEKADGMIGSLVVALPSRFTGGEFVIEHHDETLRTAGSTSALTFIAFYTDCRHEIHPVTSGHRVVLTWNLIVRNPVASHPPATPADALARRVRAYFEAPKPPRWGRVASDGPPDRLVYLLDHEYTQHGLDWRRLKNADALRAARLLEVARNLDCEIFLALADVHETWSCEDDYDGGYGRRWRGHYDDDEDYDAEDRDDEDEGRDEDDDEPEVADEKRIRNRRGRRSIAYELTELIDSSIELRHWVAPDGPQGEAVSVLVDDRELCYTKPSIDCEPFDSEHEGYTGNAGNTVDHWYHRAAVVLWPRERNFVIRAKASAPWAVDEISRQLDKGDRDLALELAGRLLPFWAEVARRGQPPERSVLLAATLRLAVGLNDADLTAALLAPFRLVDLSPASAPLVADLLARQGLDGCRTVLLSWTAETRFGESVDEMLDWLPTTLPALCHALSDGKSPHAAADEAGHRGDTLAGELLASRWAWLLRHIEELCRQANPERVAAAVARLGKPVLAILEGCSIASQPGLRDAILAVLTRSADAIPLQLPVAVLRAAGSREARLELGLEPVQLYLVRALRDRLARPGRAPDDWSIHTPIAGTGELCDTLTRFLRAPRVSRLEWPLAEQRRRYVHGLIDGHGLPVRHTTRRAGSPYTLVLEKTRAVFERDAALRRFWKEELAWLEGPGDT